MPINGRKWCVWMPAGTDFIAQFAGEGTSRKSRTANIIVITWAQIQPALQALDAEATRIGNDRTNASDRTAYEKAVLKMHERLGLYVRLKNTGPAAGPERRQNWAYRQWMSTKR